MKTKKKTRSQNVKGSNLYLKFKLLKVRIRTRSAAKKDHKQGIRNSSLWRNVNGGIDSVCQLPTIGINLLKWKTRNYSRLHIK